MAVLELLLLLGILLSAGTVLLSHRTRIALWGYMVCSLLLALVWGVLYGGRLAVTELGVGVIATALLARLSGLSLWKKRGSRHE